MGELISCVMANYNTKKEHLSAAIESILNQDYNNFEFIIVDDCSTDDSLSIIKKYANKDDRIIVMQNDANYGLAYSLNRAIRVAKGTWIARMDSDDIAKSCRFKRQIKYLEANKNIDVLGAFVQKIGNSKTTNASPFISSDACKSAILFSPHLYHPTVFIKKAFIESNKLYYNESYLCAQDFELWARCVEYGNVAVINEKLLYYRVHNNQISTGKRELQLNNAKEVYTMQLQRLGVPEDELAIGVHLVLCAKAELTEDGIGVLLQWADYLVLLNEKTQMYEQNCFRDILYYKVFTAILKSKCSVRDKLRAILSSKNLWNVKIYYAVIYKAIYLLKN